MKNLTTKMKKIMLYVLSISLVCILAGCGAKEDTDAGPDAAPVNQVVRKPTAENQQQPVQSPAEEEVEEKRIRSVTISPGNPRVDSRIVVNTDLFPLLDQDGGESLYYVFYKNTAMFLEQEDNTLPPKSCKKGDSLFADVLLSKDGEEIDKKRSGIIFVLNSKPEIGEVEFPEIRGLGTYTIQVNASDADEDTLTYSLDSKYGIPAGMSINSNSGAITYNITEVPESDVKFKVVVKDGDGGEDWRELVIKISRSTVRRGTEDEEDS